MTADFSDYTHARIIEGAEAAAREQNYSIFVSGAEHSSDGEPLHSPLLSQHRAEGLLIVYHGADRDSYRIFEDIPDDMPVVTIGYAPDHSGVTTVGIQNFEGAQRATQHLLDLGHRQVAHITGPMQMYAAQERRQGYESTLRDAGIDLDATLIVESDWSSAGGYSAVEKLFEHGADFSAIFVQNDRMAIGVLQALREHRLRIPEDVAVIGFDDIPAAMYFDPPLTTVRQPSYELGQAGARLLIERVHSNDVPAATRLETQLVIRQSCGAAASSKGGDPQDPE